MSIEALDWDTISLKLENSIYDPKKSQKNLKEPSLSTAIDLNDNKILQFLAKTKGGLVNKGFREKIWPILLGVQSNDSATGDEQEIDSDQWRSMDPHKDEDQVSLDVDRSFVYYPRNIISEEKTQLKLKLKNLIVRILRKYPDLSYYQGYHDICTVFLIIFQNDLELCFNVVENFTLLYLRDFMMPNINVTIKILRLIPELIAKYDRDFYKDALIDEIEPFYALSPLITLFAHDITNFDAICEIFDGIIANCSLTVVIYYFVSLLIDNKYKVLEKVSLLNEEESFAKQDIVHDSLSKFLLDLNSEDVSESLNNASNIWTKFPITSLKSFKSIQPFSVLKTSEIVRELNEGITEERLKVIDQDFISKQIEDSKKLSSRPKPPFSFKEVLLNSRMNQNLFKLTITIGIISLLLNIILKKTDTTQLINNILHIWNNNNVNILNVGIRPFKDFFLRSF